MKTKYSSFINAGYRPFYVVFALAVVLQFGALDTSARAAIYLY